MSTRLDERSGRPAPRWDRRRTIGAAAAGALVLGILALLVIGLLNRDLGTGIQDALAEGERPPAPELTLPVLIAGDGIGPVGSEVSLSGLRGRAVVLNFWASWCTPCEREAPILEAIRRRYRGRDDVLVLGVDVQDLRGNALAFAADHGIAYPSLRDPTDETRRAFEVGGLPETFVIDPGGRIALKHIGELTSPRQITTALDRL